MLHRNHKVSMGAIDDREYQRFSVLEENVRRLREAVADIGNAG